MCVRCGDLLCGLRVDLERGRCLPFLLLLTGVVSHTAPVLFCVFFSFFDGATWAKGSALAPSGTSADSCIHDSVRYFSEAVMALAWSLRRGYYHIGCTRESYWPTNRSSCPCINLIESVVNCTAIRCAPITSPQPPPVIDSYPS